MRSSLVFLALLAACTGELGPPIPGARGDGGTGAPRDGGASTASDAWSPADATAPSDGGGPDPCASLVCPANARCEGAPARCVCAPGFVENGPSCVANEPGNPALHTQQEVCTAYRAALAERAQGGGFTASAGMCDPGTLSRDGLDDALRRLNFHRWLAGVGPTANLAANDRAAQACAVMSAWNPAGPQAHSPPTTATCYSAEGAGAAGSSNIAWGNQTAANAIDQWFVDWGNETTYGHRRWLLNPPLSDVGIGAYVGGNNYGSASCIIVFGGGGSSAAPRFIAYPPPGFVPAAIADGAWTIQGGVPQANLQVVIRARSTGQTLQATAEALIGNYGNSAGVRILRPGWSARVGETYQVELSGDGAETIRYELSPVACD